MWAYEVLLLLYQLPIEEEKECVYLEDAFKRIVWKTLNYNYKTNPGAVQRFMFGFDDLNLCNQNLPLFISNKKRMKLGKKKR